MIEMLASVCQVLSSWFETQKPRNLFERLGVLLEKRKPEQLMLMMEVLRSTCSIT